MYVYMHVYLFVDTREHCDVPPSSEPFNSRHIQGLTQVRRDKFLVLRIFKWKCWVGGGKIILKKVWALKKEAYCFATVGRSVGQSVGMLVGLSVYRPSVVRSISVYPFTWSIPKLVQGLPSISRWPLLYSGHMFKDQGQTTLLSPVCCPLDIFWPLHLIYTKLGAGVCTLALYI